MVQWVKDLALSLPWLWSLLWLGFNPWPGNFRIPLVQPRGKAKQNKTQKQLTGQSHLHISKGLPPLRRDQKAGPWLSGG